MATEQGSLVGTRFAGRFQIESVLGKGGMGEVFLARHTVLERLFAIKVIQQGMITDPNIAARFRREARAASRVQHPNITAVVDFGHTEDGQPYLVMEYVEGPTLATVLAAEGALPVPRALRILAQLADALTAAHACQVVHRDLKPHNILLTMHRGRADVVKVLDFGLAKIVGLGTSGPTCDRETVGTPDYMSPEQCAGRAIDHRSDIYSCGVLAYRVLVGETPFSGTILERAAAHLNQMPPTPSCKRPELTPLVDQLVLRCMAKSRRQRYQSATELAQDIGRARVQQGDPGRRRKMTVYYDEDTGSVSYDRFTAEHDTLEGVDGWDDETTNEWSQRFGEPQSQVSLEELACSLRDRGLGSSRISAVLAQKIAAEDQVFGIQSRLAMLETTWAEVETSGREREARLRQALAQLEHERVELNELQRSASLQIRFEREELAASSTLPSGIFTTEIDVRAAQLEENALGIAHTIRSLVKTTDEQLALLQQQIDEQRQRLASARQEAEQHHAELAALVQRALQCDRAGLHQPLSAREP